MNPVTGVIRSITVERGMPIASVSVDGTLMRVPLVFVREAAVGDTIVISAGIALTRLDNQRAQEQSNVSGHPGKDPRD